MEKVTYHMIPIRRTRKAKPGDWDTYVPAIDLPPGVTDLDPRIQFTPSGQPFVVFRELTQP